MNYSASSDITQKYQSLSRGSFVLTPGTEFNQKAFIENNRKYSESLKKPLLQDYHVDNASARGLCSAAVLQWLSTGSIPPSTENMVIKLSQVQGSAEVDNERDFLTWCSNVSDQFKNLKKVKNSNNLDLNNTQTLINYLLDNTGQINTKFKLFLILVFKNGTSHAVGLNLETKSFFDPNSGVLKIHSTSDAATNITYSIFGLELIRTQYPDVVAVTAITYL